MEFVGWIAVFVIGMVFGYFVVLLWRNHKPEPSKEDKAVPWEVLWNRELPRRDDNTPMKSRILDALKEKPLHFTSLLWKCRLYDNNFSDKNFWDALQELNRENKVDRVGEPTTRDSSMWALAREEETDDDA